MVAAAFKRNWVDRRTLMAAGAGAGLATAFNAPIAGAVFVLEELVRKFELRMAVATFGASAAAIAVAREFIGTAPDFQVENLPHPPVALMPFFVLLGVLAGVLGVAYNRFLVWTLSFSPLKRPLALEFRAGFLGAIVGLAAWFCPALVGGGESLTQSVLSGKFTGLALVMIFLLRFILGPLSYASRVPGGLFAPMLVLGAQSGFFFGGVCLALLPAMEIMPLSFAVVGMSAFFSAVVRAPVTGIVLITELTGNYNLLLPMLAASFAAILIPTLCGNPPIYDSLKLNPESHEHLRHD
jgi:CIC family chloride channel protein